MLAYSEYIPSISIPNPYIYMHILMLTRWTLQFSCIRLVYGTRLRWHCSPTPCHLACSHEKHTRPPFLPVSVLSPALSILIPSYLHSCACRSVAFLFHRRYSILVAMLLPSPLLLSGPSTYPPILRTLSRTCPCMNPMQPGHYRLFRFQITLLPLHQTAVVSVHIPPLQN